MSLIILIMCPFTDKMKDGIVSKIAMQCSCYYAEALKLMQIYSVQTIWPKVNLQRCIKLA